MSILKRGDVFYLTDLMEFNIQSAKNDYNEAEDRAEKTKLKKEINSYYRILKFLCQNKER